MTESLIVDIPTQDIINKYTNLPKVNPPPQYKDTVESGLRIASIGEGDLSNARVVRKRKKKTTKGKSNTRFAHACTRIVKSNPPNSALSSFLVGDDEQFIPSSEQCEKIESTTNSNTTQQYKCSFCSSITHLYPKCPFAPVVDAGVVKAKKIVTGDYVVYSVREHPSEYTDADKPIEIAAMSSDQINKPVFRAYNPDGTEQSELSSQTNDHLSPFLP